MVGLTFGCVFYATLNIQAFQEYDVVTQFKIIENETVTFPAITLCFFKYDSVPPDLDLMKIQYTDLNISQVLHDCYYDNPKKRCSPNDFEPIVIHNYFLGVKAICHKFNGGKDAKKNKIPIRRSNKFGKYSGLTIGANLTENSFMLFHICDNLEMPVYQELINRIQPEKISYVSIKKTINRKLPEPFTDCKDNINAQTSRVVKFMLEEDNITYRRANCYELCLVEFAFSQNLTSESILNSDDFLNFKTNCSDDCPLECTSSIFEVVESEWQISGRDSHFIRVNFYMSDDKYTEITQSVKVTEADVVSNVGGVVGLFLDLSFAHVHRFIFYVFEVFFV